MNSNKFNSQDVIFICALMIFISPFLLSNDVYQAYLKINNNHGFILSFVKFSLLATTGEAIGLRITSGVYNKAGFGLLPRAIVWGLLGITIKMAFIIFASGVPVLLTYAGLDNIKAIKQTGFGLHTLIVAFAISVAINVIYAPIMMTLHKVTDMHITNNGGTVKGFFTAIQFAEILTAIDWQKQWHFVFKKTIPFFWIPAHTITFLLPADMQILFAALLGVALGVILSFANTTSAK